MSDFDAMPQSEFASMLGISTRTVRHWRSIGHVVTQADGDIEIIRLKAFNTSGPGGGGRVLVLRSHNSFYRGFRYLGATEFIAALGYEPITEARRYPPVARQPIRSAAVDDEGGT